MFRFSGDLPSSAQPSTAASGFSRGIGARAGLEVPPEPCAEDLHRRREVFGGRSVSAGVGFGGGWVRRLRLWFGGGLGFHQARPSFFFGGGGWGVGGGFDPQRFWVSLFGPKGEFFSFFLVWASWFRGDPQKGIDSYR